MPRVCPPDIDFNVYRTLHYTYMYYTSPPRHRGSGYGVGGGKIYSDSGTGWRREGEGGHVPPLYRFTTSRLPTPPPTTPTHHPHTTDPSLAVPFLAGPPPPQQAVGLTPSLRASAALSVFCSRTRTP